MSPRHVGRHRPGLRPSRVRQLAVPVALLGVTVSVGLVVADARADELHPTTATAVPTASGGARSAASDALLAATANRSAERVSRDVAREARTAVVTVSGAGADEATRATLAADRAAAEGQAKAEAKARAATEAKVKAEAKAAAEARAAAAVKAAASRRAAAAHRWVGPVSGYTLTSGFGVRWGKMHPAQDLACPVGTPVHALSTGTVVFAGWSSEGYGNFLKIRYWDGTVSWMAHNSRLLVAVGDEVSPGQTVAHSGNTGRSTGPHVHLEIHPGDAAPVAPIGWLATRGIRL